MLTRAIIVDHNRLEYYFKASKADMPIGAMDHRGAPFSGMVSFVNKDGTSHDGNILLMDCIL